MSLRDQKTCALHPNTSECANANAPAELRSLGERRMGLARRVRQPIVRRLHLRSVHAQSIIETTTTVCKKRTEHGFRR